MKPIAPPDRLSPLSALWSFLGRQRGVPGWLRKSARRKFSRRERGQLRVVRTCGGFELECRVGDPLDNLVYFDGEFEPELAGLLRRLAPELETIVDVGCNIGYVSCLLATLTRGQARLLSLDANPEMARRCTANLERNGFRANVVSCAVGRTNEKRAFHIPRDRPSYASFGRLEHASDAVEVPVRRLDDLAAEHGFASVDLLKIDVEGFEPEVLAGLGDLRVKNICLEFSPGNLRNCGFSPDDLWKLPLWQNYTLYQLEAGTGQALAFDPKRNEPGRTETIWACWARADVVATPRG